MVKGTIGGELIDCGTQTCNPAIFSFTPSPFLVNHSNIKMIEKD
jgi:hypothetical protein